MFALCSFSNFCYNEAMNPHFLQSGAWEKFEQLEGHTTFRLATKQFSALAVLQTTPVGNYLYCPYGPTINPKPDFQANFQAALDELKVLAREQECFFIRIEPTFSIDNNDKTLFGKKALSRLGLIKSHDINPAHTWVLDLDIPQNELLKGMRSSNLRYYKSYARKGVTIEQSQDPKDIHILEDLLTGVAKRNHFNLHDQHHLENQLKAGFTTLYVARFEGKPVAAALIYDHNGTRFYAHAAKDDSANHNLSAGMAMLVQMIVDAQNAGAKAFDFWGVTTSEDPKHPWYGFTQYKKSFGGHLVSYAGTWDLPLNRPRYRLYQVIRRLNRLKRKLIH